MLKVNGKAYDWGDVDLKIPGLNIQVKEISYDDELEMEEVYGYGSKPRGYGTGNYKASGKLSMLRDDYDDLLAYCKQKGVPFYKMELPSIIVSYANEGARTKIDELKKVKFSKRSNKAAQGDKSLTVDVDMMIVGGVYQDGVAPEMLHLYALLYQRERRRSRMKTLTSIGIQKIGQRFVDSVDHADYTLNGVPQTAEPFRRFVQGASARVYIYFDDTVIGDVAEVQLVDKDGDIIASAGERVFTKTPGKGLYI